MRYPDDKPTPAGTRNDILEDIDTKIDALRKQRDEHMDYMWLAGVAANRNKWQYHLNIFTELVHDIWQLRAVREAIGPAPLW